jgi:bifunctional non-homologous end joining protein LigD
MVSKRKDSKYRSGASTSWLKAKSYTIGEFELLGVSARPASRLSP